MTVNTSGQTTYTYKSLLHSISQYYTRLQKIHSFLEYRTPESGGHVTPIQFIKVAYESSGQDSKTIKNGRSVTIDKLPVMLQLYVTLVHMNYKNEMFYDLYYRVATYNHIKIETYRTDKKYVRYIDKLVTLLSSNRVTLDRSSDGIDPLFGDLRDPKKNLLQLLQLLIPYQTDPTLLKLPDEMLERIYQNETDTDPMDYDRSARYESEYRVLQKRSGLMGEYTRLLEKVDGPGNAVTTVAYESTFPEINNAVSQYNRDLLSLCYTDDVDDLVPLDYIQNDFMDEVNQAVNSTGTELDKMVGTLRTISVLSADKRVTIPYYSIIPEYITILLQIKQDIESHERAIQLFRTSDVFDRTVTESSPEATKRLVLELSRLSSNEQEYKGRVKNMIEKNQASLKNINERMRVVLSDARGLFLSETAIMESTKKAFLTKYKDVLVPYSETNELPPIHSFLLFDMGVEDETELGDPSQIRSSIRSHLKKRFLSSIQESIESLSPTTNPSPSTETPVGIKKYISGEIRKNLYSPDDIRLLQHVFTGVDVSGCKGNAETCGGVLLSILKNQNVMTSIPVPKQETMKRLVDEIVDSGKSPDTLGYYVVELTVYLNMLLMGLPDVAYTIDQYIYRLMLIHKNSHMYYLHLHDNEETVDITGGGDGDGGGGGVDPNTLRKQTTSDMDGEKVLYKRYIEHQFNQTPMLKSLLDDLHDIYQFTYVELINYAKEHGILTNFLKKYESNMADALRTTVNKIPLKSDPRYNTLRRLGEIEYDIDAVSDDGGDGDDGDMVGLFSYLKTDCIRYHSEKITEFLVKQKGEEFSLLDPTTGIDTLTQKVEDTFRCVFDDDDDDDDGDDGGSQPTPTPLYRELCQDQDLEDTKRRILTLFDYHDIDNTKIDSVSGNSIQERGVFLSNNQIKDMYGLTGSNTDLYTPEGYLSQKTKTYLLEEHSLFISLHEQNGVKGVQVHYRTDDMKERILSLSNFLECIDDFHTLVHDESPMLFMRNRGFIEEIEKIELSRLLDRLKNTITINTLNVGDTVVDSMENVWVISRTDGGSGKKIASIQTISEQTLDEVYSFDANMIKEFNNKLDATVSKKRPLATEVNEKGLGEDLTIGTLEEEEEEEGGGDSEIDSEGEDGELDGYAD